MPFPPGVSLTSAGVAVGQATSAAISGNAATDWPVTVQVVDANGLVARAQYTITAYPRPTIATNLPDGTVGVAYTGSVTGSNGSGSYAYAVSSGALPTGLALNGGSGAVTGTPTVVGTYNFTLSVTADLGGVSTKSETIVIAP